MKRLLIILIAGLSCHNLFSQSCDGKKFEPNKISNGSFETAVSTCTSYLGQGGIPDGWSTFGEDNVAYINYCSSPGTYDPVANIYGTEAPQDGEGYFSVISGPLGFGPIEEYYLGFLRQQLETPLIKGVTYYIELQVSLADISQYGVKSLGMYLTDNPNDLVPNTSAINYFQHLTPQIPNAFPAASAYLNYSGWTKICGYYTPATDDVQYILIGNFRSGGYQQSSSSGYNGNLIGRPIYYIDGIYISEYSCCPEEEAYQNTSTLPPVTAVNNAISAGSNVTAGTTGPVVVQSGSSVTFKAGNTVNLQKGFSALSGSNFTARISPCTRGVDDNQLSININFQETSFSTYTLTAVASNGSGNYSYQWSNGARTQAISAGYGANVYTVVVTDNESDPEASAPCDVRIGVAEFIDTCPICRPRENGPSQNITTANEENQSSTNEEGEVQPSVYPNPSRGLFTLRVRGDIQSYIVSSLQGHEILKGRNEGESEILLDLSDRAKGIYILRMVDSKNKSITQLIVKD